MLCFSIGLILPLGELNTFQSMKYPLLTSFAIAFIALSGFNAYLNHVLKTRSEQHIEAPFYIYHTTSIGINNVIGYSLHKRQGIGYQDTGFAVIVRDIDPKTDKYKDICKAIVADIAHDYHNSNIDIAIYDSTDAYELYETGYLSEFKLLTASEIEIVNSHTIAIFHGVDCYNGSSKRINYYELANNGLTEQEYLLL